MARLHDEAASILEKVLSRRASVKSAVLGGTYEVQSAIFWRKETIKFFTRLRGIITIF